MHFCQSRITIFFVCPREGAGRRAGRACRQGVGTGFPPHGPTLWSSSRGHPPTPQQVTRETFPVLSHLLFFLSAAINMKLAALTQRQRQALAQSCQMQPGCSWRGEAPQSRLFPRHPLTTTGRGSPAPIPRDSGCPELELKCFCPPCGEAPSFYYQVSEEGEPLLALPRTSQLERDSFLLGSGKQSYSLSGEEAILTFFTQRQQYRRRLRERRRRAASTDPSAERGTLASQA